MSEIRAFLEQHLAGIFAYDVEHYRRTVSEDLGLFEWYITPHRIDGVPFHEFLMTEAKRAGAVPLVGDALQDGQRAAEPPRVRFDLANYREQRYGDTAVCSYTLLTSTGSGTGIKVQAYNESRVIVKFAEGWKVVHVHKSPTYTSPITPPR
ncbi:MAG: nuclear transport factor 2 family protein [Anaerolineales bacterium]|nr:nuclear transport factor 2 family protein [Anaerolineales bacterium]